MTNIAWTDARIERLKALWETGASASVIAAEMHTTRNSVLGKADRLNLPGRSTVRMSEADRQASKKRHEEMKSHSQRARRIREREMQEPRVVEAPKFVGSLDIPFADLRNYSGADANQCRYIAAEPPGPDYLACGNETLPGASYCCHCSLIVRGPNNMTQAERAAHISMGTRNHLRAQRIVA